MRSPQSCRGRTCLNYGCYFWCYSAKIYLTDHHVDGVDVELRVVAIDEGGL